METTFLAPKGVRLWPGTVVLWRQLPLGAVDRRMERIRAMNAAGYGVHYGVAVRSRRKFPEQRIWKRTGSPYLCQYPRGSEADTLYLTALYADADAERYAGGLDEAREQISTLRPSITIASGGGYHALLLLDMPLRLTDENRAEVKRTLKGIARASGCDPAVAELARVLRLPGTVNTKPERAGARCEVVDVSPVRHCYDDLMLRYAPFIPQGRPHESGAQFDGDTETDVIAALKCIPADSISYQDWITVLAALYHDFDYPTALHLAEQWSAWCSNDGEVEDKMATFGHGASATTAHVGSIFHMARQYGYQPDRALSNEHKRTVGQHIAGLQASARDHQSVAYPENR
ncbi:MAG: PriCT-2 domain-containing protein [Acidithiobacillus sp.]|nr:PriCT-2 domain-containing protein [Acidithiobacillus sp.]